MLNFPQITAEEPPMRKLNLAEYADFNAFFLRNTDKQQIRRQKTREENITKRFQIIPDGERKT